MDRADATDANVTHPALLSAIASAERAYEEAEAQKYTDTQAYDYAWDQAFKAALTQGLDRDDAKVVATSAASDGNADDPKGYKDIIPPFVRTKTIVNRTDYRKNHAKKEK
jgi:hypothetical protein